MCNQILPLSIKKNNKNKYDEKVTKNNVEDNVENRYYQILENVKKAHKESVISSSLITMDIDPDCKDEAEALADLILNCVTCLDFIHRYENDVDFKNYVHRVISDAENANSVYYDSENFYTNLFADVMQGYHVAKMTKVFDYLKNENGKDYIIDLEVNECDEESCLGNIIMRCKKHLEKLGYNDLELFTIL